MTRPNNTISLHDAVGLAVPTDGWITVAGVITAMRETLGINPSASFVANELHIGYLRMTLTRRKVNGLGTQYRRTHLWTPTSDAGKCYNYQLMDKKFGTRTDSPLHHNERCPLHGTAAMIRKALT